MAFGADLRIAALGFAVTTAYGPGMLSPGYVARWGVIAVGLPLLMSIDPRRVVLSVRWILAFVLVAALIPTVLVSPDQAGGLLEFFYILLLCLALFAGAQLDRLDGLMIGVGIGLIPTAVLAVTQRFDLWSPLPQFGVASGLFYNSEVMAEFAVMPLLWGIVACIKAPRRWWWLVAVSFVPVAISGSRISMAMVVIGLLTIIPHWRWRLLAAALALIAAAVLVDHVGIGNVRSLDHRLTLWGATFLSWNLFGHGLGWYQASYPYEQFAHSDALQAVAEIGIAAFALLGIVWVALKSKRGGNAERALFIGMLVQCVVSYPLHFPASGFMLAVVAGFLVGSGAALRMVVDQRGSDDDGGAECADETGHGYRAGFPGRSRSVSVRSVHQAAARLQYADDQPHPTGA